MPSEAPPPESADVLRLVREHIEADEPLPPKLLAWLLALAELGADTPTAKRRDKERRKWDKARGVRAIQDNHGVSQMEACRLLLLGTTGRWPGTIENEQAAETIRQAVRRWTK